MAEIKLPDEKEVTNSFQSKLPKKDISEEKPQFKKVVTGKVVTKKKSFAVRFKEAFFGDSNVDVKDYLLQDFLVPTIKETISNIIGGCLGSLGDVVNMSLFGDNYKRTGNRYSNRPYTSYGNYYNSSGPRKDPRPDANKSVRTKKGFDDIILDSKSEAQEVLENMFDALERFGKVSVADLNELLGVTGQPFTDNYWGWTDLSDADVRRVREGYLLVLPPVVSLR